MNEEQRGNRVDYPRIFTLCSALTNFINDSLVIKYNYQYQTNINESFISLVAKYADKSTAWQISYRSLLSANILHKNQPYKWIYEARSILNLHELSPETKKILTTFSMIVSIL